MAIDYPSNFSNGTSVDSLGTMLQYADYATNLMFAEAILAVIFVMTLLITSASGTMSSGLLAAAFVTFIFSVFFFQLGMINPAWTIILLVVVIVGWLVAKNEKGRY